VDYCCAQVIAKSVWKKLGLIFQPDGNKWWQRSHAALPVPLQLEASLYRVYFASRDDSNRSHVGYFDIDLEEPTRIRDVAASPVLAPGPLGYFDDHGVYAASAVKHEGKIYLYTIGWNPGVRAPLFYSSIGLAISEDGGQTFEKYGRAPIMARSEHDPCLVTSPMVLNEDNRWRMWYVSGTGWTQRGGVAHSTYHIKYAESSDGVNWRRDGRICIDNADARERNIGRTCVLRVNDGYHAWFCYDRGAGYRIGHARSGDGLVWRRQQTQPGLELSQTGWDSEAMAYPYVIPYEGKLFLFYNGNGFGKDGIGVAVGG
jgi:predicted GH43/DUF377 family glycosyl hydrolase